MKGAGLAIISAFLILAGTTAYAQQGPGPMGGAQGRNRLDAKKREEIRNKIETVRIWRLTEELKLDEKTAAKLASVLSSLDEQRRGLIQERMDTMGDLRAELDSGKAKDKKLSSDLAKLEKNRRQMASLDEKEINSLKGILSIEQQARYVIFQQQFRREIRRMIAEARGGSGMRGPRGVDRGPGSADRPMRNGP